MHEQRLRPSGGAEPGEQLDGRDAGARQRGRVDSPHPGDVGPRSGVGDHPVAGQLVALEAVLAPALPVALTGERSVAGTGAAGQAERDGEVDRRGHAVGALGRLLQAPSGEHVGAPSAVRGRRGREQAGSGAQGVGGDAAHRLRALGPPPRDRGAHGIPPGGSGGHVLLVDEPLVDEDVGEGEQDDEVAARHGGEVDAGPAVGQPCRRRGPRVDDDQAPARPRAGEVLHEGRHRRCGVGADDEHGVRAPEVREREGQAPVDAEAAVGAGRGRGHAEPAVVVDVRRAQHDPRELAQGVGLLVGEAASAEHGNRVPAVHGLDAGEPRVHEVESLLPRGRPERPPPTVRPDPSHERRGEAVGGGEHLG